MTDVEKQGKPSFKREPNRRAASASASERNDTNARSDAAWTEDVDEELGYYVRRLVNSGACILLTRSADKGVLGITVFDDTTRWRGWYRCPHDALAGLRDIIYDVLGE